MLTDNITGATNSEDHPQEGVGEQQQAVLQRRIEALMPGLITELDRKRRLQDLREPEVRSFSIGATTMLGVATKDANQTYKLSHTYHDLLDKEGFAEAKEELAAHSF